MRQILFRIPPWSDDGLPIYGYGLMLFMAFLACTWVASWRARRVGVPKETIQDLAIWIFIGGLAGSRTAFLLLPTDVTSLGDFLRKFPRISLGDFLWQFPRIWDGGVIFYGAVIGAAISFALAYHFQLRKRNLPTLKLLDIIAPAVAIGLCFGRVGCLLNGCCYGDVACTECAAGLHCPAVHFPLSAPARFHLVSKGYQTAAGFTLVADGRTVDAVEPDSPAAAAGLDKGDVILEVNGQEVQDKTDLDNYMRDAEKWRGQPWPLALTVRKPSGEETSIRYVPWTLGLHPTQVYESISMFLLFLLLNAFYPFRRRDGAVLAVLMIGYGLHRFFNEQLRGDDRPVGFEVYTSVLLLVAGLVFLIWLWRKPPQYQVEQPSAEKAIPGRARAVATPV
jgi:prolipoprotein diacylglyceryltransferase